jgi:hypothetical protein
MLTIVIDLYNFLCDMSQLGYDVQHGSRLTFQPTKGRPERHHLSKKMNSISSILLMTAPVEKSCRQAILIN